MTPSAYLQKHLQMGLTLGDLIARSYDLEQGTLGAIGLSREVFEAKDPRYSLDVEGQYSQSKEKMRELIASHLTRPASIVVLPSPDMRRADPFTSRLQSPKWYSDQEVYVFLHGSKDGKDIQVAMNDSSSHTRLIVFGSLENPAPSGSNISSEVLHQIASSLSWLALSAYDTEGFITWTPDKGTAPRLEGA